MNGALMIGIAAEVSAEHAAALRHAGDAVEHARRAGAEPAHFFATAFALIGSDDASVEYLTRPVRGDHIECALRQLGLPDPAAASWRIRRCQPVVTAMGVAQ